MSSGKYRFIASKTEWELVPAGNYLLELTRIEDGPIFENQKSGASEPTAKLFYRVVGGPSDGLTVDELVTLTSTGPKSKLRARAQAFIGRAVGDDEAVDLEDFIGVQVQGAVLVAPDSKGVPRNRIDYVVPLLANNPAVTAPAAPDAPGSPRLVRGLEAAPARELPEDLYDSMEPPPPDDADAEAELERAR